MQVFQKEFYNGIPNVTLKGVESKGIEVQATLNGKLSRDSDTETSCHLAF
jgi:hypothetical protein